jgi:hypothetical protein
MENIEIYLMAIPAIIGAASLIVAGLEKFAKITPTTKDDEAVGKVKKYLSIVSDIVSKFSLNSK